MTKTSDNRGVELFQGTLDMRIAAIGIAAAVAGLFEFVQLPLPGVLPVFIGTGVVVSLVPASRASRVDVVQALRSESMS